MHNNKSLLEIIGVEMMDVETQTIADMIYRRIMPEKETANELAQDISKYLKTMRNSEIERDN